MTTLERLKALAELDGTLPPGSQHWLQEGRQGTRGQWQRSYGNHDGIPSPAGRGPFKRKPRRPGLRAGQIESPYYGRPKQRN